MPLQFPSHAQAADISRLADYLVGFRELDAVQVYKQQSDALLLRQLRRLASANTTSHASPWHILEVGCGLGDDLASLSDAANHSSVIVGLDHNVSLLHLAEERHASRDNLRFVHGTVTALPFPDSSFHACRADRVLQHIPDISAAMREMCRVLVPGGAILLLDTDWQTLVVDSEHPTTTQTVCESFRAGIVQPYIGRELGRHCHAAGLHVVGVQADTLLFHDLATADRVVGLRDAALTAMDAGVLDAEDLADWIASLSDQSARGEFFCAVTGFAVCAVKESSE